MFTFRSPYKHSSSNWLLLPFLGNRIVIKTFHWQNMWILIHDAWWSLQQYSSQKALHLSAVCSATVWGYIKHTYAHLFTQCISLSFLRCLQPINIHLSGISLALSLVLHDKRSKVSVHPLLLIWYYCCQSTSWSLSTFYLRQCSMKKVRKHEGPKDLSLWTREDRERVGLYTEVLLENLGLRNNM